MNAIVLRSVALCALALTTAGVAAVTQRQQDFPHEDHAGMFPLCEGCHQGVPAGDRSEFYPPPSLCEECHDGAERPRVDWRVPTEEPDNVVFDHADHPGAGEPDSAIDCTTCHTSAGAPRMAVAERPVVPRCLDCHDHRAEDHFLDADCTTCHMPLAQAPFDRARLIALPEPADHRVDEFLAKTHGDLARARTTRCAVCHTRERCESCHVDAADVNAIEDIPAATGMVAQELPAYDARYPVPASHMQPEFLRNHGAHASAASCAACHTREDCTSCHVPPQPDVVLSLSSRTDVRAPGAQVLRRAPPSHRAPLFEIEHGNDAAVNSGSCAACHSRTVCADCHEAVSADMPANAAAGTPAAAAPAATALNVGAPAEGSITTARQAQPREIDPRASDARRGGMPGAFHPPNFLARHSAEAYARRLECSSCHDSRLFCADCHASAGMNPAASRGRLGPGFHDAEPLWLLRHGQAARQGLESCTSCHTQNECMQCHSVLGAFKVSPHGPGFDARRAQRRNAAVCLVCHITDPLNGRDG